jgi:hypothetical protein
MLSDLLSQNLVSYCLFDILIRVHLRAQGKLCLFIRPTCQSLHTHSRACTQISLFYWKFEVNVYRRSERALEIEYK